MKQKGHACRQAGFTLIELLVTMGIIAVLTGMAIFNFNQSRMRARDIQRKNDLGQLIKALELFKNDNGSYPNVADGNIQTQLIDGGYTKVTFVDPRGSEWASYQYKTDDVGYKTYFMMACLENKADNVRATTTQCSEFPNGKGVNHECDCGLGDNGVMYVVSNP
jgi:prepilin-type N-terminal cleavage/methylation domain-containing protein